MKKTHTPVKAACGFLCLLMTVILLCPAALGSQKEETVYEWIFWGDASDAIRKVQVQLEKLYYFVDGEKFTWGLFDERTVQAIRLFCADHNFSLPPEGISPEIQKYLLEESPAPRRTPTARPETATPAPSVKAGYEWIGWGESSDAVRNVQVQLEKLYYFADGGKFTWGLFDERTLEAIRLFCAEHNFSLPQEGISPEIQKYLLEESPAPRETPTVTPVTATPTAVQETPFPTLTRGSRSTVINEVQNALFSKGYYDGLDGRYVLGELDALTEAALTRFCDVIRAEYRPEEGLTESLYLSVTAQSAPVYPKPTATPLNIILFGTESDEVRDVQQRLNELGYFQETGEPVWGKYDPVTSDTVRLFCTVHSIPVHPNGMDSLFLQKLYSEDALPYPRQKDLVPGDDGDNVREIQNRLYALGYYGDGQRTGVYDQDMLRAVALFATVNQIVFRDDVVTVSLQESILDEKAVPYQETQANLGFFDRISASLSGNISFVGIQMPLYIVIIIVAVILAGLVFLLVHVFSSGSKEPKQKKASTGSAGASQNASKGASRSASGAPKIRLDIRYLGNSTPATVTMDKPLLIGRTEKTLPIDETDSDISRKHCSLTWQAGQLILRDYSTNGTKVNHQPCHHEERVIHSGDVLTVGKHEISITLL